MRCALYAVLVLTFALHWIALGCTGTEALGKTLGVIGCGRIGRQVAHYAQGFGMNVIAFDEHVLEEDLKAAGIEKVDTHPHTHVTAASLMCMHA